MGRIARAPSVVAGLRLAFHRGRGRAAMPVASTIASMTLGVVVLATATAFWFSLNHFLGTPRLYGVTWDARVGVEPDESFSEGGRLRAPSIDHAAIARKLAAEPGVDGVSVGRTGFSIATAVDELLLELLVIDPVAGRAPMPPLLDGRYPVHHPNGEIEVMLGVRAADRLGARAGDRIRVMFIGPGSEKTVHVTGIGVVPVFVDTSRIGESAVMPLGVMAELGLADSGDGGANDLFVRGKIDLERIAALAGPGMRAGSNVHVWPDGPPEDVVNFGRVNKLPVILGLLLGAFAAATLAHTLIAAIGRRRRDLALLKTLGFVRAQIRRAVLTQSLALVTVAFAVGFPVGLSAGRWLWRAFAQEQGVVVEPVFYPVAMVASALGALAVAALVAALPARAAARTQPALILRTE